MPLIRYTHEPDVALYGSEPIEVYDVVARTVVADRRAVLVDAPEELAEQTKAELLEHAREVGVEVKSNAPKAKIVEAIQDAQAS